MPSCKHRRGENNVGHTSSCFGYTFLGSFFRISLVCLIASFGEEIKEDKVRLQS